MPIHRDESGKRWVDMAFVVSATPEQVWQAMATGPGNSSWFTPTTIEEGVGGAISFEFGTEMCSRGEVTEWEPPHRFAYVENEWQEGAPPLATEITITGRSGGRCLVRMVHSLFATDESWDDQMEGFENGWPGFFDVLKIYLEHFFAQEATTLSCVSRAQGTSLELWHRLLEALNLHGADVGQVRALPDELESLEVAIERTHQDAKKRYLVLRAIQPFGGVVLVGTYQTENGVNVSVTSYLYGDAAKQTHPQRAERWREWHAALFGTAPPWP